MAKDIRNALEDARDTIVADALGAASLVVLLVASLTLPSFL
jgi:hypothetical protein